MAPIRTLAAGGLSALVCLGATSSLGPASAVIPAPELVPAHSETAPVGNQNFKLVPLDSFVGLGPQPAVSPSGLSMQCKEIV